MTATVVQIQAKVHWTVCQSTKSRQWIGVCEPLKITLQDRSLAALTESIEDAIDLFFKELLVTGDLEKFLRDHGWKLHGEIPENRKKMRFEVPWDFKREVRHDTEGAFC